MVAWRTPWAKIGNKIVKKEQAAEITVPDDAKPTDNPSCRFGDGDKAVLKTLTVEDYLLQKKVRKKRKVMRLVQWRLQRRPQRRLRRRHQTK